MAGWYELSKSRDGQFRFVLKDGTGDTLLTSELCTEAAREADIARVKADGASKTVKEKT